MNFTSDDIASTFDNNSSWLTIFASATYPVPPAQIVFLDFEIKFLRQSPFFFKLGFTPCKAEQPLRGMQLQEKAAQKD